MSVTRGFGTGSICAGGFGARSGPPPPVVIPPTSGLVETEGFYEGEKVIITELRDAFNVTNAWRRLRVPGNALKWDLINESTTHDIDVNFQDVPDRREPPFMTLEYNDEAAQLQPDNWRPSAFNVRGTIAQGFYFYYILPWETVIPPKPKIYAKDRKTSRTQRKKKHKPRKKKIIKEDDIEAKLRKLYDRILK